MDILGIGTAQLCVYARVDEDFPSSLGFHRGTFSEVSETRIRKILARLPYAAHMTGGHAIDVVKTASALGLETGFMGKTDNGAAGEYLEARLADAGVRTFLSNRKGAIGFRITLIGSDGTRTVMCYHGDGPGHEPDSLPVSDLRSDSILYIDLDRTADIPSIIEASRQAAALDARVAVNVQPGTSVSPDRNRILSFLKSNADMIFISEQEAETFLGKTGIPEPAETSGFFDTFIIQYGESMVGASDGNHTDTVRKLPVQEIDSTGAEAAFAAGFLYGRQSGASSVLSLEIGSMLEAETRMAAGTELDERTVRSIRLSLLTSETETA